MALASKGWRHLRSLNLLGAGLTADVLRVLARSSNLRGVTRMVLGEVGIRDEPALDLSPEVAAELAQAPQPESFRQSHLPLGDFDAPPEVAPLPHLANLQLTLRQCDPRSRRILSESKSLAWVSILCEEDEDIQAYRAHLAPECWPPLDLEPQFASR
jgi:hypothetical protein